MNILAHSDMASNNSPNYQGEPSTNALVAGTHHCPRCDRIFKRVEHLKRHQRTHDGHKQFTCTVCSKSFARSDILHRHEQTHTTSPRQATVGGRRACVECAKARERCTKEDICLRCFNRSLSCVYPPRRSVKALHLSSPQAIHSQRKTNTNAARHVNGTTRTPYVEQSSSSQQELGHSDVDGETPDTNAPLQDAVPVLSRMLEIGQVTSPEFQAHELLANAPGSFPEVNRWGSSVQQQVIGNPTIEYPMNWLPFNETIGLDYHTILGFNINTGNSYEDLPITLHEQTEFNNSTQHLDSYDTNGANFSGLAAHPFEPSVVQSTILQSMAAVTSPAATISSSQGSSIETRRSIQSGLYATSTDGARTACTVRTERSRPSICGATPLQPISHMQDSGDDNSSAFDFPNFSDNIMTDTERRGSDRYMNYTIYETIKENFRRLCFDQTHVYPAYHSQNFPSLDHMNLFIRLYFDHFDSILPVIHHRTDINSSWLLTLAVCSIGSQYSQIHEFDQCVRPLHEFLRRALALRIETISWTKCDLLLMLALVLSQVGLSYHGSSRFLLQAKARHGTMIEIAKCSGIFALPSENSPSSTSSGTEVDLWETWVDAETKRRLAFSLWLMDCMSVYHFGQSHVICVEPPDCSISHEELWVSKTAHEWAEAIQQFQRFPTFSSAIRDLFIEKELKSDIGGFGSLILLHGIYQEFFKVKGYHARPLSSWVPSLNCLPHSPSNSPGHESVGFRSAANISNWRNAALDCLDVLHWAANATIAKAAGVEHPNVLHLHFARVVLLAPYQSIQVLAKSIINLNPDSRLKYHAISRDEATQAEEDILRWAQRDEHKARLAILHCGCFYWHIRRYSCDAFYEPISVYLVTLTLWAYCSYTSRVKAVNGLDASSRQQHKKRAGITTTTNGQDSTQSSDTSDDDPRCIVNAEDDDSHEPTFIRLDRPNDDEMVQLFVRKGRPSVMTAHIAGVGNICSSQGPIKILREGRKILSTVSSSWGRSREYTSILETLEMTMGGKFKAAKTFVR